MATRVHWQVMKPKTRSSKKAKNGPNVKEPSPETKESLQDDDAMQLLDVAITAINITKDLVPIDLAKGILGTVANILIIAQDSEAIVDKCETIREILERATKHATDDDLRGYLGHALSQLNKSVNRINSEVASKKEQGIWQRLLSVTSDRDRIAGWEKDLDRVIPLFSAEMLVGLTIGMNARTLGLKDNVHGNVERYHPPVPPSRPSMFYGREDLVAELTNLVVNDEHIALIGFGGMGKSSLAKAIINEPPAIEKFADRRFFVTYDGLDPSTITFETFTTRFAGALGIELAGADPMRQISALLRSASALVVLDNAETFEEASGSSALGEIPPAIADIANIPGVVLILTCSEAGEDIRDLLKELEFHPLSINLLTNAAQQNDWSPAILLKRWNDRHSAVLNPGKGKLQSLSDTMQLSLDSPSIQALGEDGRRTLAIIAFLPQGLNDNLAGDLLPSLQEVDTICDVLRMQSLVYRQDNFIKVLAPIQHYVQDSLPLPDSTRLQEIRTFYYRTVHWCSKEQDGHANIIISDHFNIEHVVAFDLAYIPDVIEETYDICWQFLWCLQRHLPRPTILTPIVFKIIENSSTRGPKACCLQYLGALYTTLTQLTEGMKAFKTAKALYLTVDDHENAAHCVVQCADIYRCQGRFIQSQQVLEAFQHADSWTFLSEASKAYVLYFSDKARMYTLTAFVDELFVKSREDRDWGLPSNIWYWRANFYHGGDFVQANTHLEDLLPQCPSTGDLFARRDVLEGLAQIAFCEGRLSDAMDILHQLVEMFEGQYSDGVLWYTVQKAIVASKQENHDLARELIHKSSEPFQFFALRNARAFLHRSYGSALIELAAGEYDKAASQFTATIEGCNMQGNLHAKAFNIRGLGEVAFVQGDFVLAAQRFAETRCLPFHALSSRFEGWGTKSLNKRDLGQTSPRLRLRIKDGVGSIVFETIEQLDIDVCIGLPQKARAIFRPQDSDDNVIQLLGVIISAVSTTKYIAPNILLTWRAVPVRWRNTRKPSQRDPQVCTISGQKQIRFPGDSQEMQNYQGCIERATKDTSEDDLQGSLGNAFHIAKQLADNHEMTQNNKSQYLHKANMYTSITSAVNFLNEGVWGLWSKICHWISTLHFGMPSGKASLGVTKAILTLRDVGDKDRRVCPHVASLRLGLLGFLYLILSLYALYLSVASPSAEVVNDSVASPSAETYFVSSSLYDIDHPQSLPAPPILCPAQYKRISYGLACVELNADEYDKAASHFAVTIEGIQHA
ncbi:hypothetical protein EV424DRAFT_1556078 [Suillus variegatus]|nr:hypothetical protein EV424DRAFT_1556078 [Suillus variegatus]